MIAPREVNEDSGSGQSAGAPFPSPPAALVRRLTEAIGPEYEVIRPLGGGGMGYVFLARDVALDRVVAIKAIRPELATEVAVQRFLREARILARLRHSNIIPVHAAGMADGLPYYVMEYVEGETLEGRVRRGPLPETEAVRVGRALLDALAAAHAAGVVHRDIKPANIFLTGERVLLGDFGVARIDGLATEAGSSSDRVGTPGYMAPEQSASGEATERSDVYAAGMVLYEALMGRPWVPLADPAVADWSGVSRRLRAALHRALAWDPEHRWTGASAFHRALSPRHHTVRRITLAGWAVAVAAVLGLVTWLWWVQRSRPELHELVVLPFQAAPASAAQSGEHLANLVDIRLSGVPQLALAPFETASRWWAEAPDHDRADAAAACAAQRARQCVIGRVEWTAEDVEVRVRIVTRAGAPVHAFSIRAAAVRDDDLRPVADSTALALLEVLDLARSYPSGTRLSDDWIAVEHYLAGEQAFYTDAPAVAARHYQAALERDSGFALARWRLVNVWRWLPASTPDLRPDLEKLALAGPGRLSPLDSMLVQAQRIPPGQQRLSAYAAAVAAFPLDAFPRMLFGEELFHRGPLAGRRADSAAIVLEQALELDSLLVPVIQLLAWHRIRTRDAPAAARTLGRLTQIVRGPADERLPYAQWLQIAYRLGFEEMPPAVAVDRVLAGRTFADRDVRLGLRMGIAFDLPGFQIEMGRRFATGSSLSELRADGHYAEALGHAFAGRDARALAHLDSAAAIAGTGAAALHAAQWRVLPPALGLEPPDEAEIARARDQLMLLARRPDTAVRALWTLGLDAALRGDTAGARDRRGDIVTLDSTAMPLLHLLDAALLAERGRYRDALDRSRLSLASDAHQRHGDPFARSALHLLRARWFEQTGDMEGAERALRWADNLDIVGWPAGEPQAAEVDWVLGLHAVPMRARIALERYEAAAACSLLLRLRHLWDGAEPSHRAALDALASGFHGDCAE